MCPGVHHASFPSIAEHILPIQVVRLYWILCRRFGPESEVVSVVLRQTFHRVKRYQSPHARLVCRTHSTIQVVDGDIREYSRRKEREYREQRNKEVDAGASSEGQACEKSTDEAATEDPDYLRVCNAGAAFRS